MKTIEQILTAKNIPLKSAHAQLILGYCHDTGIYNEQQLNLRKIANKRIINKCIKLLRENNGEDYIKVVRSLDEIKDVHDIYAASTTFGTRIYSIKTDMIQAPAMKLNGMLKDRMNNMDTCFIQEGTHESYPLYFTGLLLEYPAHKWNKTSDGETIIKRFTGYKG
jgi:hypothetical protein